MSEPEERSRAVCTVGFTISCDHCGSHQVLFEVDRYLWRDEMCADVYLVCQRCDHSCLVGATDKTEASSDG